MNACILIVDDDPDLAGVTRLVLQRAGYRTLIADSSAAALSLLQTDEIDLVLLDIMLPDQSGLEVCRAIRQDPARQHLPIIMVTALAEDEAMIRGLDEGADDYIAKPYKLAVLLARIRAQLRIREAERELEQHNRDLAALNDIAATIISSLQLDDILAAVMQGIHSTLDAEAGILALLDEEQGELVFKQILTEPQNWIVERSHPPGRGLIGHSICQRTPLLVNDVADDGRCDPAIDGVGHRKPHSLLCVPLLVQERAVGAVAAMNKRKGAFTARDLDLLSSIAHSAAIAIENARLFHKLMAAYTELETSRWQVLHSRNTLQALFDGITDSLYIVDATLNLVAVNQARAARAAIAPEAAVGRPCYEVLWGNSGPCPGCQITEVLSQSIEPGQKAGFRRRINRQWGADGQLVEWDVSVYPICDAAQTPVQAIVLERDVTETRRLEASLAQSEKLAAIGQLAAGVAHEINNPLTAIIANAQLLQKEVPSGDPRYESVDLIVRAGERARKVVRSLLDFARQERPELQPTDINASLASALDLIQHQLRQSNIQLDLHLTPGLPAAHASHDRLQSVWLNLILNARDAVAGRPDGKIRIQTARENGHIRVAIADNGPGIPPEQLKRVLEPFFTTKAPGQGTGLGLSTCYRIVKQHGGDLAIQSQVGQGTTVVVNLPLGDT